MRERPVETSFYEMFIDGSMMLAREGARVTKLYLPTRDFVWLAYQANAHDECAQTRPVMRPDRRGTADWANSQPSREPYSLPVVQVGDRFTLHAPWGAVEIFEDKET